MKVCDLFGKELDKWVGRAEGVDAAERFSPSTDWAQAGPIIERSRIIVGPWKNDKWAATIAEYPANAIEVDAFGSTYLEAAMRAYVTSKFGEEVDECTPYK